MKERPVDQHLRFEELISELSAALVRSPPREVDRDIEQGLRRIVEFLGADRGDFLEFSDGGTRLAITHSYAVPGVRLSPLIDIERQYPWYAEKLRRGESVIFSRADELPDEAGAVKQYARKAGLKLSLSIPLAVAGAPVCAIAFHSLHSERTWPAGWTPRLRLVGELFAGALLRRRAAEALEDRLRFEGLLSDLSSVFVNLSADHVDETIREGLRKIVSLLDLDRSTILEISSTDGKLRVSHTFQLPGVPPPPDVELEELIPVWAASVHRGEALYIPNPGELAAEAWREKQYCERQGGIRLLLSVPLQVGGRVLGAVTFVSCRGVSRWPEELLQRLRLLGEVFANALQRKHSDERLQAAFREIQQLQKRLEAENVYLRDQIEVEHRHEEIVGDSPAIRGALRHVEQVAPTDSTVLLLGETGTGKELLACAIHNLSPRRARTMVKVNCAALPATLIETELFGRERGAYTGAQTRQIGRFEAADGSTIFLDEVGELPLELQSKLLRVLQEGQFERLGSAKTLDVDVRVIAATNRDLARAVREGTFREDLYYRLNVFPIRVPPLRERPEDIPALVRAMVAELGEGMGRKIESIPRRTLEALRRYSWPGNVRELRNVIERALILNDGPVLRIGLPSSPETVPVQASTLADAQRRHILSALEGVGWRVRGKGGAAEVLGLKPSTLESKMKKLGIRRL